MRVHADPVLLYNCRFSRARSQLAWVGSGSGRLEFFCLGCRCVRIQFFSTIADFPGPAASSRGSALEVEGLSFSVWDAGACGSSSFRQLRIFQGRQPARVGRLWEWKAWVFLFGMRVRADPV